jgi:hypothetical protein
MSFHGGSRAKVGRPGAGFPGREETVMKRNGNVLKLGVPMLVGILALAIAIARFGPSEAAGNDQMPDDPGGDRQVTEVTIESVDVRIAESFPPQIFVEVRGYVPDPCWEVQQPVIEQDGPRWEIEIVAERDGDAMCAQVIEPYEETISLGPVDPGDYAVSVNGNVYMFSAQ